MRHGPSLALVLALGVSPAAAAPDELQTLQNLCALICGDWITDDYDPDRQWTKLKLDWDAARGEIVGTQIGFAGRPTKPGQVAIVVRYEPATERLIYTMQGEGAAEITFEVTAQTRNGATLTGFVPSRPEIQEVIEFERMGPNHIAERRKEMGEGFEQISGENDYLRVGSGPH